MIDLAERIEHAEAFFAATGADVRHGGNRAFYAGGSDHVQMPVFECFHSSESYYATLAHEMTHWIKHPKRTSFGAAPADEAKLVEAFLKDHRFLLTTPNAYNALGVGSTQLYIKTDVYNHKRHGRFKLGRREFDFRVKPHFPSKLSEEFLLVDLVDNLERLAERNPTMLEGARKKAQRMNPKVLKRAVKEFGGSKARKFFAPLLAEATMTYAS